MALSAGPAHGYAITTGVKHETGRALGPRTMYAALAQLEQRGLIEPLPAADRRHPARLTDLGAFEAELTRPEALASRGRARLRRSGS